MKLSEWGGLFAGRSRQRALSSRSTTTPRTAPSPSPSGEPHPFSSCLFLVSEVPLCTFQVMKKERKICSYRERFVPTNTAAVSAPPPQQKKCCKKDSKKDTPTTVQCLFLRLLLLCLLSLFSFSTPSTQHRGTSLIRTSALPRPCSRTMPRALWWV